VPPDVADGRGLDPDRHELRRESVRGSLAKFTYIWIRKMQSPGQMGQKASFVKRIVEKRRDILQ